MTISIQMETPEIEATIKEIGEFIEANSNAKNMYGEWFVHAWKGGMLMLFSKRDDGKLLGVETWMKIPDFMNKENNIMILRNVAGDVENITPVREAVFTAQKAGVVYLDPIKKCATC